jgi:uncharacterized membrane protein
METIIDEEDPIPVDSKGALYHESVRWWENRRLYYNLLLFALEAALLIYYAKATKHFGVQNAIVASFAYQAAANFFYSVGWGTEVLLMHYLPNVRISQNIRWLLFIFGVVFSIILTITWYQEILVPLYLG